MVGWARALPQMVAWAKPLALRYPPKEEKREKNKKNEKNMLCLKAAMAE